MKSCVLHTEEETQALAAELAQVLSAPLVLTLSGEIGAGKTTFVRALLLAQGYKETVKSPTFSIVETYAIPNTSWVCHHFDLYRILEEELDFIGFRDYFTEDAICCIEWPEKASRSIDRPDISLLFQMEGEGRKLSLRAYTPKGQSILDHIVS